MAERDTTVRYRDLAIAIIQYAKALRASSVQAGMLAGIACDSRYPHLLLLLACEIMGVTAVSLPSAAVASDNPILSRCDILCLGPEHEGAPARRGLLHLSPSLMRRISLLAVESADLELLDFRPADDAVVTLVCTSGSTGRPKVIAMTHRATRQLIERTTWQPDDPGFTWNFLNLYNFTNRSAYQETAIALRQGCTVVLSGLDTAFGDMTRFAQFRTTLVSGDAVRLAHAIPADWAGPHTGLLHIKGGALSPSVRAILRGRIVSHVYHNYGANEVSRISILDDAGVGTLLPGVKARIMTAADSQAPAGEPGLIEVQTPGMANAYLWDDETSRATFRDGWYRTGDIGFMPAPGRLVVLGRADDWVNLGGVKFLPTEIEQRIGDLDGIQEAVLLSWPDAEGHDRLHVVIESRDPSIAGRHQDALIALLSGHPGLVITHVLSALPRTDTGKPRRQALRRLLAEGNGAMAV